MDCCRAELKEQKRNFVENPLTTTTTTKITTILILITTIIIMTMMVMMNWLASHLAAGAPFFFSLSESNWIEMN